MTCQNSQYIIHTIEKGDIQTVVMTKIVVANIYILTSSMISCSSRHWFQLLRNKFDRSPLDAKDPVTLLSAFFRAVCSCIASSCCFLRNSAIGSGVSE